MESGHALCSPCTPDAATWFWSPWPSPLGPPPPLGPLHEDLAGMPNSSLVPSMLAFSLHGAWSVLVPPVSHTELLLVLYPGLAAETVLQVCVWENLSPASHGALCAVKGLLPSGSPLVLGGLPLRPGILM